ncbi:glycosyltransferase [Candidatus Pacearchaeota archaeon]|nr:glycosyltransferase [Candidatus Pacearchaeota archaeon]
MKKVDKNSKNGFLKGSPVIKYFKEHKIITWVIFFILIYIVLLIKFITIKSLSNAIIFDAYSVLVSLYILSRFGLSYFYEHDEEDFNKDYEPTISFAVPSKNEGENIRETILRIAKTDYPKNKFDIIAINDGSTDNTLEEMLIAKNIAAKNGIKVRVVDWKVNRGKREGMAECIRMSKKEIMIFIDSDSFVEPSTAKELVKYFYNKKVAAVVGHAFVANEDKNVLTKMQAVRYYVAFKAYKSAEALFGKVTCCSGCCSAYRREYVLPILDKWSNQKFLGVKCTYGDDRSLTNFLLKNDYSALYAPEAIVHTFVPEKFGVFMRQQLRWKKSWVRESFKAGSFIWKANPIMSIFFYLGLILPLIAPVIVIRALLWHPYITHSIPYFYIIGLLLMGVIYGLYYYLHTDDKKWPYGVLFATFCSLILVWQLPWAIANLGDSSWGTR